MTDLAKLKVSLTKHGAHKISRLVRRFAPQDVLANTEGRVEGVNIDRTQAAVIMSEGADGTLPAYWSAAKGMGGDAVDAITMLSIIFSHHAIIRALQNSSHGFAHGVVVKPTLDGKAFTNFKNDLIELGFAQQNSPGEVEYDFRQFFRDERIPPLAAEMFGQKLRTAGWNGDTDLIDECVANGFHEALAVPEEAFREWLSFNAEFDANFAEVLDAIEDLDETISSFSFKHGHSPKKEAAEGRAFARAKRSLSLAHNRLQTMLHAYLVELNGERNVGTEVASGIGQTAVDVVARRDGGHTFYELKTGRSLRKCIREALPQLLEYAYWPDNERAAELIIVAPIAPTDNARSYLAALRRRFDIPIYYQQLDNETGRLLEKI